MSAYEERPLDGEDWQYKIMRGDFTTQDKLERMLDEQGAHGWRLLEVFDDQRVRLRRLASEALKDGEREGNPYETLKPIKLAGCLVSSMLLLGVGSAFLTGALVFVFAVAL